MSKAMQLKAKIRNLALKNHVPAQAVLQNFMLERLLERISISKYKDTVILKGGNADCFTGWDQQQNNYGYGCNPARISPF